MWRGALIIGGRGGRRWGEEGGREGQGPGGGRQRQRQRRGELAKRPLWRLGLGGGVAAAGHGRGDGSDEAAGGLGRWLSW